MKKDATMSRKVIVTVAPTSNFQGKEANPALPEQPEEIARSVKECYDAGACLAHMHARDRDGVQTNAAGVYREINAAVRAECDIIIQNSIAPALGKRMNTAEDGLEVLDAHPEMASLDMGYVVINLRDGSEYKIDWTNAFLMRAAKIMQDRGIKPELEIFNNSQMDNVRVLVEKGLLTPPFSYSFVMGMNRVNQNAVSWNPKTLMAYVDTLPPQSLFSTLGIGTQQFHATVQSLLLGGGVRVGFEDNIFYRKGELARSNAHLVERIVTVIRDLGLEPATPAEARDMLGIPQLGTPQAIEVRIPRWGG
jgi:3-keto-5-aminohexanoate cleavage enzyme